MQLHVFENPEQLGLEAAKVSAEILQETIKSKGSARIVLSTGASQFDFIKNFVKMNVEWDKVEMFHLDEYINLPESHPASFRKYLKERFLAHVNVKKAWLVSGEGDPQETVKQLNEEILKAPIDLALIGIGENAHIAFNDPPADFVTEEPYRVVDLSASCKQQQVGEGWFATPDDVPPQAISMTVKHILRSRHIITVAPYAVKANAIANTFRGDIDPNVPATMLKTHDDWRVYLDKDSASGIYKWVK